MWLEIFMEGIEGGYVFGRSRESDAELSIDLMGTGFFERHLDFRK
jgi:hypothetical protein